MDHQGDQSEGDITLALAAAAQGDDAAVERLWSLVYDELRLIAGRLMRMDRGGQTLQPTAVVNEAFLRLFGKEAPQLHDRLHFKRVAAKAMRCVLIDRAREKGAEKRGADWQRVSFVEGAGPDTPTVELLALNSALDGLAELNARHAQVVELRYFGGMTLEETAEQLGVSTQTVKTDWAGARAWLHAELKAG